MLICINMVTIPASQLDSQGEEGLDQAIILLEETINTLLVSFQEKQECELYLERRSGYPVMYSLHVSIDISKKV